MRKNVFLLILFIAATFDSSGKDFLLTGKIINSSTKILKVKCFRQAPELENILISVEINSNGSLNCKIPIKQISYLEVDDGSNRMNPFLILPGGILHIEYDYENFQKTINVSGDASPIFMAYHNTIRGNEVQLILNALTNYSQGIVSKKIDSVYKKCIAHLSSYKRNIDDSIYSIIELDIKYNLERYKVLSSTPTTLEPYWDKFISNGNAILHSYEYILYCRTAIDLICRSISRLHNPSGNIFDLESRVNMIKVLLTGNIRETVLAHLLSSQKSFKWPIIDFERESARFKNEYPNSLYLLNLSSLIESLHHISANMPAPEMNLLDDRGKQFHLSSLKGKIVYIEFWASWCGPCHAVMYGINKARAHFKGDTSVVFLFVNVDALKEDWLKSAEQDSIETKGNSISVSLGLMTFDHEVAKLYNISALPSSFILGSNQQFHSVSPPFPGTKPPKSLRPEDVFSKEVWEGFSDKDKEYFRAYYSKKTDPEPGTELINELLKAKNNK